MNGACRGCFRPLGPFYGSDLCPRCEARAEWAQERAEGEADLVEFGPSVEDVADYHAALEAAPR